MENILDQHAVGYRGGVYDFDNTILLNWYPQRMLNSRSNESSLLELGLGHGHTVKYFAEAFKSYKILEGSPQVIQQFRTQHPSLNVSIVETFFEDFATNETFDIISMGFILEHVSDPKAILKQYRDFLSPSGRLFITVPNAAVLNRRVGKLAGLLDEMTTLSDHDYVMGHKRYYTVESLREDIQASGFRVERLEGIYLKPLTTQQMIGLNLDERVIRAFCNIGVHYPELSCGILAEVSKG
jgi:2-polyprenyl-3-methyl-5-hydroxy-6-metoxy-1,4-benzoquinol methylase